MIALVCRVDGGIFVVAHKAAADFLHAVGAVFDVDACVGMGRNKGGGVSLRMGKADGKGQVAQGRRPVGQIVDRHLPLQQGLQQNAAGKPLGAARIGTEGIELRTVGFLII